MSKEKLYTKIIKNKKAETFIKELKDANLDFQMRKGSECYEIILDDTKYVFTSDDAFPQRKLYLFRSVKLSAEKWLKENKVKLPEERKQAHWNYDFDDSKVIAGTDLNHAYWRIAYLLGVISEKIYMAGLDEDCKQLRLATISILGRRKVFDIYEKGIKKDSIILQEENREMREIFTMIRRLCYSYMAELANNLDKDFLCWKTDCIYYVSTDKNIKFVQDYFTSKNLTYKQLAY